jgi:hypothetical protein
MNRATAIAAIAFTVLCAGCNGSPSSPSQSAVATLAVADERFRVSLTSEAQIAAARAAQAGGRARIPTGQIVSGTQVNTGWSWHLEDVTFAESTIELCDGRPSDVERQGTLRGRQHVPAHPSYRNGTNRNVLGSGHFTITSQSALDAAKRFR